MCKISRIETLGYTLYIVKNNRRGELEQIGRVITHLDNMIVEEFPSWFGIVKITTNSIQLGTCPDYTCEIKFHDVIEVKDPIGLFTKVPELKEKERQSPLFSIKPCAIMELPSIYQHGEEVIYYIEAKKVGDRRVCVLISNTEQSHRLITHIELRQVSEKITDLIVKTPPNVIGAPVSESFRIRRSKARIEKQLRELLPYCRWDDYPQYLTT